MRLDQLPLNMPTRIAAVEWDSLDPAAARRLQELGVDEGVSVELLHRAPFGADPVAFRIGKMTIALRVAQASALLVEHP